MAVSYRFRQFERLKKREGIRKVFSGGRVYSCPGAKLFALKNGLPYNRIGFTLVRKYGNAVERNRAKRLGREAYRHLRPRLRGGYDLVLLVYPGLRPPQRQVPENSSGAGFAAASHTPCAGSGAVKPRKIMADVRLNQLKALFVKAGLYQTSTGRTSSGCQETE
jgi:ribonuclease P protein component